MPLSLQSQADLRTMLQTLDQRIYEVMREHNKWGELGQLQELKESIESLLRAQPLTV